MSSKGQSQCTSTVIQLGWVHPRIIESLKGLTRDQLDGRRKAGKYIEGEHWIKDPVGSIMWNFENLNSWVESANTAGEVSTC